MSEGHVSRVVPVVFAPDVQAVVEELSSPDDPLDDPGFDPVAYINSRFPTEQSLASIDDVITEMESRSLDIEKEIHGVIRAEKDAAQEGHESLIQAKKDMQELFGKIREIKWKSEESEMKVKEITRDIKTLDLAKRNLTTAITTLNHVHMLVGGVNQLRSYLMSRSYSAISSLLPGVISVMENFDRFSDVPQIKQLGDDLKDIKGQLASQVLADFKDSFTGKSSGMAPDQLASACLVVSSLDPSVRRELLSWFINLQLEEYVRLFADDQEAAWLDMIDRRYQWLKRFLVAFEDRHGKLFPSDWEISERIAVEFCHTTRTGLSRLLNARRSDIDVKVLLYAIKRTIAFEELLGKRFDGGTLLPKTSTPPEKRKEPPRSPPGRGNPFLEEEEGEPDDGNPFAEDMVKEGRASGAHPQPNPFEGIVSKCFEEHLGVYVESQDKNLHGLMDRFVTDLKQSGIQRMNGEDSTLLVTAGDLFLYYKKCLVQCSQLSTGQPMLDLVHVFQKFLRDYCQRILAANLPKASSSLSRDLSTAGLLQNFQTLLKEGDLSLSQLGGATSSTRLSAEDIDRVCCVLTASEYCLSTADQLEAKLKEKISRGLKDKVNLSPESDAFRKVISTCVALLVQDVQAGCETALATMNKISWQNVDTVGDCSPYVNAIGNHLNSIVPRIREGLTSSMKFFLEFCSHFVSSFIPRFLSHLYKCKPMSPVGAEQALLDAHMLKTTLLDLPSVGARIVRKPPASYTKIVSKGMGHVEMVLKVVMAANDPPKMLVEQFIACVKDGDAQEFQKCLEMMSIKKQDQAYCLELYKAQKAGAGPSVGLRGALLSPPSGATGPSGVTGAQSMAQAFLNPSSALDQLSLSPEGKIKKLEKLIRKGL